MLACKIEFIFLVTSAKLIITYYQHCMGGTLADAIALSKFHDLPHLIYNLFSF